MKSLNRICLIGHLGHDPEVKYTAQGVAVATFSLATNERERVPNTDDEWQDKTEWHRCVAWRRTAEIAGEYLAKGRQCYVEGRLQTRTWEDQQGQKRYMTEIVVRDLILLGGKDAETDGSPVVTQVSGQAEIARDTEDIPF